MGTSYLIDTHVLIWMTTLQAPPSRVDELLQRDDVEMVVSAVSAYELAFKVGLGKLDMARPLISGWDDVMDGTGARALPVTARHGIVAGSMEWAHRDPFDRLLVAQAQVERLTLVTADRAMLAAPGIDVLPW